MAGHPPGSNPPAAALQPRASSPSPGAAWQRIDSTRSNGHMQQWICSHSSLTPRAARGATPRQSGRTCRCADSGEGTPRRKAAQKWSSSSSQPGSGMSALRPFSSSRGGAHMTMLPSQLTVASIGCVGCQLQSRTISRWYASAATSLPLTMSARARGRARQHRQCLFCKAQLPLHQLWGGFLCVTARICTESVCHLIPHNTRCGVICQLNRLRLDQLQIPAGSLARPHDAACSCDAGQRLYCLQEFETLQ